MFTTILLVIAVLVILVGIIRFLSREGLLKPIMFLLSIGVIVYVCMRTDIHKRLFSKAEELAKTDFTEFVDKVETETPSDLAVADVPPTKVDVPPTEIERPKRQVRKYPGDTIYMPGASPEKLIIRWHRPDSDFPLESELKNGFDLMRNDTLFVLDGGYERIYIYPKKN